MTTLTTTDVPGLLPRAALDCHQRDEMFALLTRHFDGVTRAQFEQDLAGKDWVIEIRDGAALVGFSTLRVTTSQFAGEPVTVIYSGDTIMSPESWGTPVLARTWIAAVNRIRTSADRRCFWLLLTSGFRTYRFLPVFWREFFPRVNTPTPPAMQHLLHQLAREEYGRNFNPATGIVRFPSPQRLRGPLARVPDGRERNPHVAFFLERNPGHLDGDELACVTEIADANLTAAGRRMAGHGG